MRDAAESGKNPWERVVSLIEENKSAKVVDADVKGAGGIHFSKLKSRSRVSTTFTTSLVLGSKQLTPKS